MLGVLIGTFQRKLFTQLRHLQSVFQIIKVTWVNTMIITTPTVPFIPVQPTSAEEPPAPAVDHNSEAPDRSLNRTKRALKGFPRFGRRSPSPPPLPPALPPPKSLPKAGPSPKPGQHPPVDGFKGAGQTVIVANKIKANDDLLMAGLRKQAPISVAEATKRLIDAESLVKSGVIATGPNASRVARDAFISAGITGLVSAPINVAAYAGSVATGETIKATYAPGVLPPPFLPGATSQSKTPASTSSGEPMLSTADPISAQVDEVEMKLLGMASTVMFTLGDTSSVFTKNDSWPTGTAGRLDNLEKLLGLSEQHLKKATRQNGLIFKPYKPGEPIPADPKGRLNLIEKKLERMTEAYERLRFLAAMKDGNNKADGTV